MRFPTLLAAPVTAAALAATLIPSAALAAPPPADALKLSEIVARVEAHAAADLAYIDDVSWDDDGYWEVDYKNTQGREVDLRVDPVSGAVTPK